MDIASRLAKFIKVKKLSANELSKIIEIQRSTLSHILNGRNKPSLDLIERLSKGFNDLNIEWLILGVGEMLKSEANPTLNLENTVTSTPTKDIETPALNPVDLKEIDPLANIELETNNSQLPFTTSDQATLDYILLVYKNGTFKKLNNSQM